MPTPRCERSSDSLESTTKAREIWAKPSFELISLDCEITAYAPDGDSPLF
jgi:hypothetical protein